VRERATKRLTTSTSPSLPSSCSRHHTLRPGNTTTNTSSYLTTSTAKHSIVSSRYQPTTHPIRSVQSLLDHSRCIDAKACTDLLFRREDGCVLLGKRCVEPQPDWWFVGGRMRAGERPCDSARRIAKRELQLDLEQREFDTVGHYSFLWYAPHISCRASVLMAAATTRAKRAQPPVENGTAGTVTDHIRRQLAASD